MRKPLRLDLHISALLKGRSQGGSWHRACVFARHRALKSCIVPHAEPPVACESSTATGCSAATANGRGHDQCRACSATARLRVTSTHGRHSSAGRQRMVNVLRRQTRGSAGKTPHIGGGPGSNPGDGAQVCHTDPRVARASALPKTRHRIACT